MQTPQEVLFGRYPILKNCEPVLNQAIEILTKAYRGSNKLLICGNGGSAADSEHMVGELMKGFLKPRAIPATDAEKLNAADPARGPLIAKQLQGALPAISLVSQTSINTAVANDTDAEMTFAQQVYGLGRPGDVLFGISTSGNSGNVVNAAITARAFGLTSIALTGLEGGKLATVSDLAIRAPADRVDEIQELHLAIYHWLCIELEERFFS